MYLIDPSRSANLHLKFKTFKNNIFKIKNALTDKSKQCVPLKKGWTLLVKALGLSCIGGRQ